MNDNEPLKVGDRVQRRGHSYLQGTVWSIERGMIIVEWNDEDENVYVLNRAILEKVTDLQGAAVPLLHLVPQ